VIPSAVRGPLFSFLGTVYPKMDWAPRVLRAKATLQGIARDSVAGYLHSVSVTTTEMRERLYSPAFLRQLDGYRAIEVFRAHARRARTEDPLALVQYIDFKTYLPGDILVKVDRASMAHSLEVRVPLLDYTLVQWAAELPPHLKLRNGEGKWLFKKSLEPYVPHDTLYRPKMGFAVPLAQWFRGPLRQRVRDCLLEGALARSGLFRPESIRRLVDEHQSGVRDHSAPLWSLLMFDGFLRNTVQP